MSDATIVPAFVHDDYERITDDLVWLGYSQDSKCSYILRFNVSLANTTRDGKRIPFHTEFRYATRKYTNVFAGNTIRRHITYYMSIESSKQDEFGNKDFIMIRPCDILYFREQLEPVYGIFKDGTFGYKDNKLIIYGKHEFIINGLAQNKYIMIKPVVIDLKGELLAGVKFILNNGNSFDMTMDTFFEFYYTILSIDMYNAASTLMNYFGRPEFGTNMWKPNDQNIIYENNEPDIDELEGNKKRQLRNNFFKK